MLQLIVNFPKWIFAETMKRNDRFIAQTACSAFDCIYILIPNFFNFFNDSYALINACSLIFSFLANAV